MSYDVDAVEAVLLADGWHEVHDWSFALDSVELIWYGPPEARRRSTDAPNGVQSLGVGFSWVEDLHHEYGFECLTTVVVPASEVRGVRYNQERADVLMEEDREAHLELESYIQRRGEASVA